MVRGPLHAAWRTASPSVPCAGVGVAGRGGERCDGGWSGQKMLAGSLFCLRANKIEREAREGSWTRPQSRLVGKTRLPDA